MSWTKRQFIQAAFNEIGIAAYEFDLSADELQTALFQLDAMMAKWNARGIRIGYPLPSTIGGSSLDDDSTTPDSANEAIYTNLAIRLAPSYGKTVSIDTRKSAREGYQILLSRETIPNEMQYPETLPVGAGNKPWRVTGNPFMGAPVDPLLAGPDQTIDYY